MSAEQDKSVLPLDIVEVVLSRLSSKSLLRFKTVCKSWNTTITDPIFRQTHLHRSKYSNSENLFLHRSGLDDGVVSLVKLEHRKLRTVRRLRDESDPSGSNEVLCFCDGVFVLFRNQIPCRVLVLWNPSIGEYTTFSSPYIFSLWHMYGYGLCHDPMVAGGVFKFVAISRDYYLVSSCKYRETACTTKKKLEDHNGRVMSGLKIMRGLGVCVDGSVYWVMRDENGNEIIYFDPRDDTFKILQEPGNINKRNPFYLVVLKGCLCMYAANGGDATTVKIWIKEKGRDNNCWTELITIENVPTPIWVFEPQCFVGNKILIMVDGIGLIPGYSNSRLLLYSPFEKTFEEVESERFSQLVPYVESLFFPGRNRPGLKESEEED